MARVEYEPVGFDCLAQGCTGQVWVTNQSHLHWYHTHSDGERPGGPYKLCPECDQRVQTVTVRCLNEDTGEPGDHGCIGDGSIHLHSHDPKTAFWYVMNGCLERPRMYPYCAPCKSGVVYTGQCRNRGCRGDGVLRCTGDEKQGLLFLARTRQDASFWPPRNCQACRDFIDSLKDHAAHCSCCGHNWLWSQGRQIMLVRNEPRVAFVVPDLCPGCLGLTAEERASMARRASAEVARRHFSRELRKSMRTEKGREQLCMSSRARFVEAARSLYRAPDRHSIDPAVKATALTRVARIGGDKATEELRRSLEAVGTDAGRISAMLANAAITDDQARKLVTALGKLAAGGQFPKAFSERLKVRGGLRMTTGLAGTASATPAIAQAAAYELHAAASIAGNKAFPFPFAKAEIASFHYRFQHNRYGSGAKLRSYEGDIVVRHRALDGDTTFVDFKHSLGKNPTVTTDELERIYHGLARGEIDRAVIVSNRPLASQKAVDSCNERIRDLNQRCGQNIPQIRTFVQPW
jgi:hypothetical protein